MAKTKFQPLNPDSRKMQSINHSNYPKWYSKVGQFGFNGELNESLPFMVKQQFITDDIEGMAATLAVQHLMVMSCINIPNV